MAVYITGDTHGKYDELMERLERNNCCLTDNDVLIITGDFGFVGKFVSCEKEFAKIIELPFTVAFVDGNHEGFDMLNSYFDITEWNGGNVHQIGDNRVYHLMRGQHFVIEGKSFFTMGGAVSRDKNDKDRVEGINLFSDDEVPTKKELDTGFNTLMNNGLKIDYILSHTVPTKALEELGFHMMDEEYQLCNFLQWVNDNVQFIKWFAGHFHVDRELMDGTVRVLYNDVIKLD